ncbi:hypothetical protein ATCC90586_002502 [Pythium insidiosum]|nr:hypothetical protein ATCC90586_002502 [Pythium insidiosum]
MRWKERVEARRAQLVEAALLVLVVAWSTWLSSGVVAPPSTDEGTAALLAEVLPRLLTALNGTAIAAVAWSLLVSTPVPAGMQELSRRERDDGLNIGVILPPLVFLGRFLAQYHDQQELSGTSLLYAWISVTVGLSLLLKIACFRSAGVLPIVIIDAIVLPLALSFTGVEAVCRCLIGVLFRFGRLALPRSFTVGEALIVAQGIGFCVFDLALVTLDERGLLDVPQHWVVAWHVSDGAQSRSPHDLALQVGVVGALLICVALSPLLLRYGASSPQLVAPPLPLSASLWFLATVGLVLALVVYPLASLLLETWNPVAWLLGFLLEDAVRWHLVVFWSACLVVSVPAFAIISRALALRQIIARKLFHVLVVVMFVPAFYASAAMLALSYGVALAAFCLVECVRAVSLPPLGEHVAAFVKPFIDHREGGRVILTHTYLLLGCAMPLWLAHRRDAANALASNAGVLALGVGDAMGAAVGSTWGKRKVFGRKTWEGTAAVLLSMLVASLALHDLHWQAMEQGSLRQLLWLLVGMVMTSLLEAATTQIDNLVLSLFLFSVCNLVTCHRVAAV